MKRKFNLRFFSLITALAIAFSSLARGIPARAAEIDNIPVSYPSVEESTEMTDEARMLRSKIDALISENSQTRETYKTDYWGHVEVTGTHTGGWHTIYGHQARVCIAHKPLDGNTALTTYVHSGFWAWDLFYYPEGVDADGYKMFVGPWRDITYMGAYRMYYELSTTGGNYDPNNERTGSYHVWIDYK